MIDRTIKERVARYTARKLEKGLVRVTVWVPSNVRQQLIDFARHLRSTASQNDR